MKHIWTGLNTGLIFLVFMYIFITKDINTKAYNKTLELEKRVDNQDKIIEAISMQKDTIVVNIYNNKH